MMYKINRLDDYGRGITYVNNKICFVENGLVDEEVEIKIIKEKSKYIEAKALKITNKSKNRKEKECEYYDLCGGCNIMHMNYKSQLEFKKEKVKNIIEKYTNINIEIENITPTKEFIYRNKITLKVQDGKLGLYKNKTNTLIPIKKCLLCSGAINETIKKLNDIKLNNINEIIIRSNYKDEVLLCLIGNNIDNSYYLQKINSIENIIVIDDNKEQIIKGNNYFIDKIDELYFRVSYNSFFQVNSIGVEILYNKILEYANLNGNESILDLYCGTGTIGMFLSKKAKNVFGIEINESCISDAKINANYNNIKNIEFECNDVGKIKQKFRNIDLVIVDPPRSGLSKEAINNIVEINSKQIIYVSCDPITLARDLNILKNNYNIMRISLVDMFPNTYHVETVSVLCRKTIEK